jgi:hypothetical protein
MICSSVNLDRFIVRLPWRGGLYPNLEEFAGLTSDALTCYDRVVASRAPLLDPMPFTAPSGKFVEEETLFLPLSEDGVNVNKILVYSYSREAVDRAASWRT